MKTRYLILFFGLPVVLGLTFLPSRTEAANQNLIPNPGLESQDSTGAGPDLWFQDQWGDNTATFSYENSGYNSNRSVKVTLAAAKSGDAKWYFAPVPVQPDTEYVFSDYYKSNKVTSIVAMSLDAQNNPTYFDIAVRVVASPANWKKAIYNFRTPPNAKNLTILHLIQKNGWLQIDDLNLSPVTPGGLIDNIPNNSLETVSAADKDLPAGWSHSEWGTSTAVYEYMNEGHDGVRSVKVTVSDYESGDAKWVYTPQVLEKNKDYRFTLWFKTNAVPHVVAQYIKNDGSEDYFGMPDPLVTGTGEWQLYSDTFSVPANVKKVSLFMFLSSNGWLQTDDYHLAPYTYTGFDKGRVTITFDDGFETNSATVLPILDKYGFKSTYCYSTVFVEGQPSQEASVLKIANKGHETCAHTVNHFDLTQLSPTELDYELTHAQSYLQGLTKATVTDFVSPYGSYNANVLSEIAKYYSAHRTTDEGYNSKDNFNPYRLRVQNMQSGTTLAQFKQWVNKAKADKTWLILTYHVVAPAGTPLEQFDTRKADFTAQMNWLASSGVTVERMDQALSELKGQL